LDPTFQSIVDRETGSHPETCIKHKRGSGTLERLTIAIMIERERYREELK
jgi:hypothetical protein